MRPTAMYERAWIAHHRLQYGWNWKYVAHRFVGPQVKEKRMGTGK